MRLLAEASGATLKKQYISHKIQQLVSLPWLKGTLSSLAYTVLSKKRRVEIHPPFLFLSQLFAI